MSDILERLKKQKQREDEAAMAAAARSQPTPKPTPVQKPEPTELECTNCNELFPRAEVKKYRKKWYCQDCLEEKKAQEETKRSPPKITPDMIADLIPQLIPKLMEKILPELTAYTSPIPIQPAASLDFDKVIVKIDELYREFRTNGSNSEWEHIFKRMYYSKGWNPAGQPTRKFDPKLWIRFFNDFWEDVTS